MPIATSSPTTILAASGPIGTGPLGWVCECECVTEPSVEPILLAVAGPEAAQPFDGVRRVTRLGKRDDAQMIQCGPIESGALCAEDLLLQQQVEDELLVVGDVVYLRAEPREDVQCAVRLHTGHPRNVVNWRTGWAPHQKPGWVRSWRYIEAFEAEAAAFYAAPMNADDVISALTRPRQAGVVALQLHGE